MGSTVMRRAALVAVERAMPQLAKPNAAAKPSTPIQKTFHRSARDSRRSRAPWRNARGTMTMAPRASRATARVAGPTSWRTMRVAT
jgi:hypothetical protein